MVFLDCTSVGPYLQMSGWYEKNWWLPPMIWIGIWVLAGIGKMVMDRDKECWYTELHEYPAMGIAGSLGLLAVMGFVLILALLASFILSLAVTLKCILMALLVIIGTLICFSAAALILGYPLWLLIGYSVQQVLRLQGYAAGRLR